MHKQTPQGLMIYNKYIILVDMAIRQAAVNAIIFRTSTGNIDAGTIKMYGIK